jgi:radical SAM/Cys-rich protein
MGAKQEINNVHATLPLLQLSGFPEIRRRGVETLQVNLGYRCNQSCLHCHVNAGPTRTEMMGSDTIDAVLRYLEASGVSKLDITGGAPELHPGFRDLVRSARALGAHVMDRCNLTVMEQPGQEDLAAFLAEYCVEVIASLPCYAQDNVDRQRGDGVFEASIRGLLRLNALGYGRVGSGLALNLVYNPQGASLPPPQAALEQEYRAHLGGSFGIVFDRLYTLANMPIQRFGSTLISKGRFNAYMTLLREAYREENLDGLMCRTLLSVDWQGNVYDCDFNQMLGLPLHPGSAVRGTIGRIPVKIDNLIGRRLDGNAINVKDHCYGCTAGQGSSCGGALA